MIDSANKRLDLLQRVPKHFLAERPSSFILRFIIGDDDDLRFGPLHGLKSWVVVQSLMDHFVHLEVLL